MMSSLGSLGGNKKGGGRGGFAQHSQGITAISRSFTAEQEALRAWHTREGPGARVSAVCRDLYLTKSARRGPLTHLTMHKPPMTQMATDGDVAMAATDSRVPPNSPAYTASSADDRPFGRKNHLSESRVEESSSATTRPGDSPAADFHACVGARCAISGPRAEAPLAAEDLAAVESASHTRSEATSSALWLAGSAAASPGIARSLFGFFDCKLAGTGQRSKRRSIEY